MAKDAGKKYHSKQFFYWMLLIGFLCLSIGVAYKSFVVTTIGYSTLCVAYGFYLGRKPFVWSEEPEPAPNATN